MKRIFLLIISLFFVLQANSQIIADVEKLERCHTSVGDVKTSFTEFRTVYSTNTDTTFLVIRIDANGAEFTLPGTGTISNGYCTSTDSIIIQQIQFDSITLLLDSLITVQTTTNIYLGDSTINVSLPATSIIDTIRKEVIEECLDYINGAGDTTKVWPYINYSTITGNIIDSGYINQNTLLGVTLDTTCNPTVSIDTTVKECIYSIELVNRFDTSLQTIDYDINQDEIKLNKYGRFRVIDCDGNVLLDKIQNAQTTIWIGMLNSTALTNNGYIDSLRVIATDNSEIWIPLTAATATLTGPGGTITAGDLIYSGNDATYDAAITAAIINYLSTLGYTETTNFTFTVSVNSGTVSFRFAPKHTPTGTWLGLDKDNKEIAYNSDGSTPLTAVSSSNSTSGGPFTQSYTIPCGEEISIRTNSLLPGEIDFTLTEFDSVVHFDPPITYTYNTAFTDLQDTCQETRITANVTGCYSTPTYLWGTGDTTQTILWDSVTVNTVIVDCECYVIQPCCITLCNGSVIASSGSTSASADTLCTKIKNLTTYEYINGTNTIEILADSYWSYSFTVVEGSVEIQHNGVNSPFVFTAGFSDSKTAYGCDYIKKGIILIGQTASTKVLITKIE